MQKLKETLTSKKFWIAVFGIGLCVANGDYVAAAQLAAAYIGVQGVVDAAKALKPGEKQA